MRIKPLAFLLIAALAPDQGAAQGFELPDQKLTVALSVVNYTRQTLTKTEGGSVPFGFGAEYSLFVTDGTALFGQFEINLEPSSQSVLFMGGGAGIAWYLLGGANYEYNGTYVESIAKPNSNLYLGLGLASRQYDLTSVDTQKEAAGIVKRDKKDKLAGNFMGLMFQIGYEYPIYYDLLPGIRLQYVKGFTSDSEPDFSLVEIWLSTGFLF